MSSLPTSRRGWGPRLAIVCVATAVSLSAQATELQFEQVFSAKGEPGTLHYQAVFSANGGEHSMEVWRDGDRRVKRRTDGIIETYAFHKPGDVEFNMSILDMKKRIHTQVDRTNLYRIGHFTDWFDLTHGLKHPLGEYRIARSAATAPTARAISDCQWYDLTQNQHTSHVCWSSHSHLPLVIEAPDGKVVWRIATLDFKPIPASTFEIHDQGYIRNDANQDIEND